MSLIEMKFLVFIVILVMFVLLSCFFAVVQSSSASPRVSGTLQNVTIDITNKRNSKNGNISKTSGLVSRYSGFSKKNAKPGIRNKDQSGPLSENILFLDMDLPKTEHELSKEATDFLLWLGIDPVPSDSLDRLKNFKKISESLPEEQEKILEQLHKKITLNLIQFNPNQAQNLGEIQDKKSWRNSKSLDKEYMPKSLLWNVSAGSSDPSLKRFRRQAEAEEGELPGWPGAPQGVLRKGLSASPTQKKIRDMMMQTLYLTQARMMPLESLAMKYDHFTGYRMAIMFLKLDQLVIEMHSIHAFVVRKDADPAMTMERRLQLYGQIVRRNVDVTYLTDYIMQRVPADQVTRIRQAVIREQQERIMRYKVRYYG